MTQTVATPDAGRQAAALGHWKDAYASYVVTDADLLTAPDLEAFAESAWWSCRADQAIELRERAFAAYQAVGEPAAAARQAISLSWDHVGRGAFAVAAGWLSRAERLLTGEPEGREHAYLALMHAMQKLEAGEVEAGAAHLDRALELSARYGALDIESIARVARGRVLIHGGEVDAGLAMLDESTAAALSGELPAFPAGLIYCMTISACQELGDLRRAAEWTDVANKFCDRFEVSGFPGACRIHRAQVMKLRGNWSGAEEQAIAACDELHDFNYWVTGNGLYEVAEIRRIRGDFAAALDTYRRADELGRDPQPGLALLRLAEGKVETAVSAVRRGLEAAPGPLLRLQLLPAQVEIALAAGDLQGARAARDEIRSTVTSYKIANRVAPAFDATLGMVEGRIAVAEGDWRAAERSLRHAREGWLAVGAPYEVAQARLHLGLAYRRQGDEDGATTEIEAARAAFEKLGARLDEERARELLGRLRTRRTFVFTDIVGSTQLLESLGDDKWRRLLARHDELVRAQVLEAGGEVIKQTGDGFFAAFDQPRAAIQAAVGVQRALDAEVVAPDVRIGVHTGGAFHPAGDEADYGGQGVHMAARVGAAAGAGQILVSRDTLDGVGGAFSLSEPREIELKGFAQPVSVVAVDWR
jgi:class 3 adenylate cyclase